jgi:hypothetical protein
MCKQNLKFCPWRRIIKTRDGCVLTEFLSKHIFKLLCDIWDSNLIRINRRTYRCTRTSPHFLFISIHKEPTVVYKPLTTLATMGWLQSSLNIHSHRAVSVVSFDSSHFEQRPICRNRDVQWLVRQHQQIRRNLPTYLHGAESFFKSWQSLR